MLIILACCSVALTAVAQPNTNAPTVTLAWNAVTNVRVLGYRLYYGPASRTYTNTLDAAAALTKQVTLLVRGARYFFAVTAYGSGGQESDYSSEVIYNVPGFPPPGGLVLAVNIASAPTLKGPWTPVTNLFAALPSPTNTTFYTGALDLEAMPPLPPN